MTFNAEKKDFAQKKKGLRSPTGVRYERCSADSTIGGGQGGVQSAGTLCGKVFGFNPSWRNEEGGASGFSPKERGEQI